MGAEVVFNKFTNARRNAIWGLVSKIIGLLFPFVIRTIIIYALGNLYVGLNSLFSSILSALNLAELGIGSALVFSMYSPIANGDENKVKALLNVYRKTYFLIGIIVLFIGLLVLPFLHLLISGDIPSDINIYFLYLIELLSTAFGYLFMAYKGSLLQAFQRADILSKITIVCDLIAYSLQALFLLLFKNYYMYIGVLLFRAVIYNILIYFVTKKVYPELIPEGVIPKEEKKDLFKRTGALFGHKVASVVINSIDNIFISFFLGLNIVAIFNNYFFIINAISALFLMLTNGMSSIVGNYLLTKNKEDINKLFTVIHYLLSLVLCFCSTCLILSIQPFIVVWTGDNNTFPFYVVCLFVLYFYSIRIRGACTLFQDASGIWQKDVLKAYLIIVIDLIIDLLLLNTIGIAGALISTIVSMLFAFCYEMVVTFKYCLCRSPKAYLFETVIYFFATLCSCVSGYFICECIFTDEAILKFVFSLLIGAPLSVAVFIVFTFWMTSFRLSLSFLKERLFLGKSNEK